MNFDRNTVMGFVILALLFFGFFYFNNQERARSLHNQAIQDSIKKATQDSTTRANLAKARPDSSALKNDTSQLATSPAPAVGQFQKATTGSEQLAYLENDLIKVAFTN